MAQSLDVEFFDENFQAVSLGEDKKLVVRDSQKILMKNLLCSNSGKCKDAPLLWKKNKELELRRVDSKNMLYAKKGINYILKNKNLDSFVLDTLLYFSLHKSSPRSNKTQLRHSIRVLLSSERSSQTTLLKKISLRQNYTPRYLNHLRASKEIMDFNLAAHGEDGGFLSIPGVTSKTMLQKLGRTGVEQSLGLIVDEDQIIGVHDVAWSSQHQAKVSLPLSSQWLCSEFDGPAHSSV